MKPRPLPEPLYRFRADRAYLIAHTPADGKRCYVSAASSAAAEALAESLRAGGSIDVRINRGQPHMVDWTELDVDGRRRRHRRAFASKEWAQAYRREKAEELASPVAVAAMRPWADIIDEYLRSCQHSESYSYFVCRAIACFEHVLKPRRVLDVTPAMCDRYFAELRAGRVPWTSGEPRRGSPAACKQDYTAMRAFFAFCERREYVRFNPMTRIEKPRVQNVIRLKPTQEDWIGLLRAIPAAGVADQQAWHLYLLLAAVTGIDRDDLLKLELTPVRPPTWEPFHFRLGEADTAGCAVLAGRRSKTGRVKLYGLPAAVSDRLAMRVASLPAGSQWLFPWRSWRVNQFEKIKAAAGFQFPLQALRAAAGTQQAEAAALWAGASLLGHSSSDITSTHYIDHQRLQIALAQRLVLPELPPMPAWT